MPDTRADIPPQPTRLADYRPPDFSWRRSIWTSISTPPRRGSTRICACAATRRRPPTAALRLDGDELDLVALALDGRPLAAGRLSHRARWRAGHCRRARRLHARHRDADRPGAQHRALRPLYLRRQFLHAMRARRLSPHHLFPRPARCDGALHRDDPRRQGALSGAAVERQPGRCRRSRRMAGIGRKWVDPHPKPSYLFALVAGDLVAVEDSFTTRSGRERAAGDLGAPRRRGQMRPRDGLAEEIDALGRGGVRPRIRSRRVQHRRGQRLQHGRDGEQGPQHLQHALRAGQARDRDRHRLPEHRGGHRPRVFPQLDRQPGDLPRLVPAVAEGRADRVPRSAVLGRSGQPGGVPHRQHPHPARGAIPRGCRPARPSGAAATAICGSTISTRATVYNKGAEADPHDPHAARAGRVPPRHGCCISRGNDNHAATIEDFVAAMQEGERRRSRRFRAVVPAGRHAGDHGRGPLRPGDRAATS